MLFKRLWLVRSCIKPVSGAESVGCATKTRPIDFPERIASVIAAPLVGRADRVGRTVQGSDGIPQWVRGHSVLIPDVFYVRTEI